MGKKFIPQTFNKLDVFKEQTVLSTVDDITERIISAASSDGTSWIDELSDYTNTISSLGQMTLIMEGAILSTMKDLWDSEKISPKITSRWEGSFLNWARAVTQRGVLEPSEVNIQNKISVYNYFYKNRNKEGGFALPPTIYVETSENHEKEIVPNLLNAGYSKLLGVKGYAVKNGGNLDDSLIASLVDPNITTKSFRDQVRDFQQKEAGIVSDNGQDDSEQKISNIVPPEGDVVEEDTLASEGVFYDTGILYYMRDGTAVPAFIRPTSEEDFNHPYSAEGANYILQRFGIESDDLVALEDARLESPMVFLADDNMAVFNFNGYILHKCNLDMLQNIAELISEILDNNKSSSDD